MKKQNHPRKKKTTIILSDGSQIYLNWLYAKQLIKVESDLCNNTLWTEKKPIFK